MATKMDVLATILALAIIPFLVVMLSIAIWGVPSNHVLERIIVATIMSSPMTGLIISSLINLEDSVKYDDYLGAAAFTWLIVSGLVAFALILRCILYASAIP